MTEDKARQSLASLCARSEHCSGEMDEKMRKWGLPEDARRRVINYLKEHQFIDDERYCRAFVNDKIKYNGWGRRKIEQALWAKQIASDISSPILDEVPDADYLDVLRPLLKTKWPTINAKSDYERSMKLIKFAMGRGFELHLIRQCIDEAADFDFEEHED